MNTNNTDTALGDEFLLREAVTRSLSASQPDIEGEWAALCERKALPTRRRQRREHRWQMLAAACAAVAVVLAGAMLLGRSTSASETLWAAVSAPEGQRCQLTLPDGTRVWLSGGSTLRYPASFTAHERDVRLTGEAFFDVTKDPRHPFTVRTQWLTARVLGTQFSIHGSSAADSHVALFTGRVEVTPAHGAAKTVTLKPGEEVCVTGRGTTRTSPAAAVPHLEASQGTFEFGDTPFRDVLTELAAWYHLAVVTDGSGIPDTRVHFSLDLNTSASEAVTLLNMLDVATVTLSGTRLEVE